MIQRATEDQETIYSKVLADRVRQLKETQEGVGEMCAEMEQLFREGEAQGIAKGRVEGILALIEALREFSIPDGTILAKVQEKFFMTAEQANGYLKERLP